MTWPTVGGFSFFSSAFFLFSSLSLSSLLLPPMQQNNGVKLGSRMCQKFPSMILPMTGRTFALRTRQLVSIYALPQIGAAKREENIDSFSRGIQSLLLSFSFWFAVHFCFVDKSLFSSFLSLPLHLFAHKKEPTQVLSLISSVAKYASFLSLSLSLSFPFPFSQHTHNTQGGGVIFLLHGSPGIHIPHHIHHMQSSHLFFHLFFSGVGKTLTAEAIAELLHHPLYRYCVCVCVCVCLKKGIASCSCSSSSSPSSVSIGELGTSAEQLEQKLQRILEVQIK